MRRFFHCIFFALFLFCVFFIPVCAHDKSGHEKDLRCVLFGPHCSLPVNTADTKLALEKLYHASYLAIDQFKGDGEKDLTFLKSQSIKYLPENISIIDYMASGRTHRSFTHRGWNFSYVQDNGNWTVRKMIILSTVNNVFNFKISGKNPEKYKGQCDSFSALLYYIHLIGDHIENKKIKAEGLEMNLGGTRDGENIISELLLHSEILFASQKKTDTYLSFISRLNQMNFRLSSLVTQTGGIRSDADFQEYHDCAEELLRILQLHIPYLLKNETFFRDIFY